MPHLETRWKIYDANESAWEAMIADCAKAKKSIVFETLIFVTDDFGQRLIDVCAERAAAGVDVRFLWDAWGSFSFFGSNIVADLQKKGIRLVFWKTIIPAYYKWSNFRSWFFRNHRRTLVVDERVGYTGSMCVADRMKDWRDTSIRLEGPVVTEMQNAFDRMWARALDVKPLPKARACPPSRVPLRHQLSCPRPTAHLCRAGRGYPPCAQIYLHHFAVFRPTRRLARVLRLAAHRGVDVKHNHAGGFEPSVRRLGRPYFLFFNAFVRSARSFCIKARTSTARPSSSTATGRRSAP